MTLAEQLKQEQENEYPQFLNKYGKELERLTTLRVKAGNEIGMLIGVHINSTRVGWSCTNQDLPHLKKWITDNGFRISYRTNGYGVQTILWGL